MKLEQIRVEYIDHMGTDLTCVNAARVSFDKTSDWEYDQPQSTTAAPMPVAYRRLKKADENLIMFLARGFRTQEWDALADKMMSAETRNQMQQMLREFKKHPQHWAPFAHPQVSLRITAPIFVARQMVKHQVGGVWSEVSRRYVSDEPSFWLPDEWHTRPEDIKQGAAGLVEDQKNAQNLGRQATEWALAHYEALLAAKVAPEEARMVLPLNTMTTWVWTGSLAFWARVANQRLDAHAQLAAQQTAQGIAAHLSRLFPTSWHALTE